jgi:hypothetical protein
MRRASVVLLVALALAFSALPAFADGGSGPPTIDVSTWTSGDGHGYVGAKVTDQFGNQSWIPPKGNPSPYYVRYIYTVGGDCWVDVFATADDSQVASLQADCGTPGIGSLQTAASLSGLLNVSVDPASGPADTNRTVGASVSNAYRDGATGTLSGYIDPSSVRINSWDIDFGDNTRGTYSSGGAMSLSVVHKYGAGSFAVDVGAHMSGRVEAAYFDGSGNPYQSTRAFNLTLTNTAGTSGAPIEYILPVVTVTGSPSGTLPGGTTIPPDAGGLAQLYWPRGLHCSLFPRADIVREGYERSGGIVIGGATTILTGYRYEAGTNDAGDATPTGHYGPDAPIAIQWNTPLSNAGSYPVALTLDLQTTYADGTVRTSTVSGTVSVTVIYSAVGQ